MWQEKIFKHENQTLELNEPLSFDFSHNEDICIYECNTFYLANNSIPFFEGYGKNFDKAWHALNENIIQFYNGIVLEHDNNLEEKAKKMKHIFLGLLKSYEKSIEI